MATRLFLAFFLIGLVALSAFHYERSKPSDLGVMEIVAIDCRDTGDCIEE